jgi:hypothetical protein
METEDLIPTEQFCKHYNIEFSFISSLSEFGLIEIITVQETHYISKEQVKDLEKMIRMHYELDINPEGIDAITHLLEKVDSLNNELTTLKNRLKLYEE